MRITESEAQRRLNSTKNLAYLFPSAEQSPPMQLHQDPQDPQTEPLPQSQVTHVKAITQKRLGSNGVPEMMRDIIGNLARGGGNLGELAEEFDLDKRTIASFKSGKVGGRPLNEERAEKLKMSQLHIKDKALERLMTSLDLIDDGKLKKLGAKDLANVATSMAKTYNSISQADAEHGTNMNFIVYSPEPKPETKFKTIDI